MVQLLWQKTKINVINNTTGEEDREERRGEEGSGREGEEIKGGKNHVLSLTQASEESCEMNYEILSWLHLIVIADALLEGYRRSSEFKLSHRALQSFAYLWRIIAMWADQNEMRTSCTGQRQREGDRGGGEERGGDWRGGDSKYEMG